MKVEGWASVGFERDGLGPGRHCIKIVFPSPYPIELRPTVRMQLSDAEQLGEALILSVRSGEEILARDKSHDDQS